MICEKSIIDLLKSVRGHSHFQSAGADPAIAGAARKAAKASNTVNIVIFMPWHSHGTMKELQKEADAQYSFRQIKSQFHSQKI